MAIKKYVIEYIDTFLWRWLYISILNAYIKEIFFPKQVRNIGNFDIV